MVAAACAFDSDYRFDGRGGDVCETKLDDELSRVSVEALEGVSKGVPVIHDGRRGARR